MEEVSRDDRGHELGAFCAAQWPRLVGELRLLSRDPDAAEDLAQEALVRLCVHWHRVRAMEFPGAWLHRVAINLAYSHSRRERLRFRFDRAAPSTVEPDPTVHLEVREALMVLPRREREAVVLRYYVGLPIRETAVAMRCSEAMVKHLTHTAIGRLRPGVAELEEIAPC